MYIEIDCMVLVYADVMIVPKDSRPKCPPTIKK